MLNNIKYVLFGIVGIVIFATSLIIGTYLYTKDKITDEVNAEWTTRVVNGEIGQIDTVFVIKEVVIPPKHISKQGKPNPDVSDPYKIGLEYEIATTDSLDALCREIAEPFSDSTAYTNAKGDTLCMIYSTVFPVGKVIAYDLQMFPQKIVEREITITKVVIKEESYSDWKKALWFVGGVAVGGIIVVVAR
jgi:hypothetical protein